MSHFPFFDLPRELRDVIYNLLINPSKEIFTGVDEYDTRASTTHIPTSALIQASKQLNSEYSDQLPTTRTLHLQGGHCNYWTGYPDITGTLARSITQCHVYIHIECFCDNLSDAGRDELEDHGIQCDAVDFLHNYRDALQPFLSQFPNLQSAHIKVGLWGAEDVMYEDRDYREMSNFGPPFLSHSNGFTEALSMLVALPLEVRDLEVVKCLNEREYEGYRRGEENGLPTYVTWTRGGGWRRGDLVVEEDE